MKKSYKISKLLIGSLAITTLGLHSTGYLDDAWYLVGGLYRGMRCMKTGIQIANAYYFKGINNDSHEYAAKKLYDCFKKNSGCYIKLGQIICQLEHIIPEAYVRELEPLCMECSVSDFNSVKKVIEREYGKPIDEVFDWIDPVPVGSASLAQVHKGRLRDGTPVAIKVQHSYIPYHCPGDILTVRIACAFAEIIFPDFKYKWLGKEFQTNLPKEIDFNNEGRNAEKLKSLLSDDNRIVIPKIYWNFTTKKILVMSFEDGKPITNIENISSNKINISEIAQILNDVFNRQIFQFGFVHSDPHPGNLFVRRELVNGKYMTRLVLLDHGLYRDYDDSFRYNYAALWRGIITQNREIIQSSCKNLGINQVELFMSILTSNTYDDIMDKNNKFTTNKRLGHKKTEEEKARLKKYAAIYHKDITNVLNEVRREMLLLLKINEFLRNIDRRIGNPINTFENMMNFIYRELPKLENNISFWDKVLLSFEYYKYMFFFSIFKIYTSFSNTLYKSKKEKEEQLNAEKVFEYLH